MVAIADTSFIVALGNTGDSAHAACEAVKRREQIMLMPQSVLAEAGYLLSQIQGNRGMAKFLRDLPRSKYRIVPLEAADFIRSAELLEKYTDSRVDFVDTTVVAFAERLNITRILTLDRRDFQIVRPRHIDHFELLP
jgi:uncharacterized protein